MALVSLFTCSNGGISGGCFFFLFSRDTLTGGAGAARRCHIEVEREWWWWWWWWQLLSINPKLYMKRHSACAAALLSSLSHDSRHRIIPPANCREGSINLWLWNSANANTERNSRVASRSEVQISLARLGHYPLAGRVNEEGPRL